MGLKKRDFNSNYLKNYEQSSHYAKNSENSYNSSSKRAYYSNASEAFELETLPLLVPRKKKKVKTKKRNFIYKYEGKTVANMSIMSALTLVFIFLYAMGVVFSIATVFNKQNDIDILNAQLKTMQETNIARAAEVASSYDLDEIERIARNELGMGPPQQHQIIHITVPKESYAIQYDVTDAEEIDTGFFAKFKNIFGNEEE